MPFTSLASPSDLFPTYLIPSLPFRRRTSSIDSDALPRRGSSISNASIADSPPADSFLSGHKSHLRCARCLTDLAFADQIVSKGFTGRHGRAYLVAPSMSMLGTDPSEMRTPKARNDALPNLPNTFTHKPVPRQLVTGAHTVSDISCSQCGNNLGWKYVHAEAESQKYKVGKFILETKKVCRSNVWECDEDDTVNEVQNGGRRKSSLAMPPSMLTAAADELVFDSQDEDECEDLFSGIWTPQLAARRRKSKASGKDR